jgi:multidrug resistance efflux pump
MIINQSLIQKTRKLVLFIITSLILGACSRPTPIPIEVPDSMQQEGEILSSALTADGRIVPKEWVQLSLANGGFVSELMVQSGDTVKKGEVLARFGTRQAVEAAIAGAEMELLLAKQARHALDDQLQAEQQRALQALVVARQEVKDAEQQLGYWESTTLEADAELADAQVIQAEEKLKNARVNYQDYEEEAREDLTRVRFQEDLAQAQITYENAIRQYNDLTNEGREFNLIQARTALLSARAQLQLSQEHYNKIRKGPDSDALSAANARILAAETQLAAAQANEDAMTLRAVMDGEVMQVKLKVGEQVAPGVPVVWLANVTHWMVESDNLTEIDVVEVIPGQKVTIVIDAISEVTFEGKVDSIAKVYEEKRGDITYTTRILMDGSDPRLRWGMTCAITFLKN